MSTPPNEGWITVLFEDIAEEIKNKVDVPSESGYDRFVGGDHLDSGDLKIKRWGSTSDVHAQKLLFKKGNILFGKRNAYLRKVAYADFDGVCSAHMMVLKPKTEYIIESLFPHFMQSDHFWQKALMISEGSMSPTIKWKILKNQEFLLPPIEEQKQIAKILWAAEDVIVKNEAFLAEAEHYKQLMMRDLFSKGIGHTEFKREQNIGEYPINWRVVQVSEILKLINGKRTPKNRSAESNNINKYPIYGGNGIVGYSSEFNCDKTSIVIGRVGEYCGSVHRTIGKSFISDNALYSLDFNFKVQNLDYVEYFFRFFNLNKLKNMTGQPLITQSDIYKINIPLPYIEEQKQIAAILTQIDETIAAARETIESTKALKMKLINELLCPKADDGVS